MSSHPNAILMAVFTPDDLARKTLRNIATRYGGPDYVTVSGIDSDDITKGYNNGRFNLFIVESEFDDNGYQIEAPEGSIVVFTFLTYGYNEKKSWTYVARMQEHLEAFAKQVDREFNCNHEIYISANYW